MSGGPTAGQLESRPGERRSGRSRSPPAQRDLAPHFKSQKENDDESFLLLSSRRIPRAHQVVIPVVPRPWRSGLHSLEHSHEGSPLLSEQLKGEESEGKPRVSEGKDRSSEAIQGWIQKALPS